MGDQGGIENDPGVKGVRQRLWTDRPGVDGGVIERMAEVSASCIAEYSEK